MANQKKRQKWLDIAKVIGLCIVLMNHVGLNAGWINYYGGMFYVSVFFVMAGFTHRSKKNESYGAFLGRKAKRLLLPYLGYNVLLFVFFALKDGMLSAGFEGIKGPLLGILYSRSYALANPVEVGAQPLMTLLNAPTWFLTGLFVTLALLEGMIRLSGRDKGLLKWALLVCFFVGWGIDRLPILLPWSLDTMFVTVLFAGLGYLMGGVDPDAVPTHAHPVSGNEILDEMYNSYMLGGILTVIFVIAGIFSGSGNLSIRSYGSFLPTYLAASIVGCILCMLISMWMEQHLGKVADFLAYIGSHTVAILCLHLFAFMILKAVLAAAGINAELWYVQAAMILVTMIVLAVADHLISLFFGLFKGKKPEEEKAYDPLKGDYEDGQIIDENGTAARFVDKREPKEKSTVASVLSAVSENSEKSQKILMFVLVLLLFLWWIPYMNKGIDLQDSGSYLTKFRYFFDPSVRVNEIHYFLGEFMGAVIYHAAGTYKVLILNVVSALLYVSTAILLFILLRMVVPKSLPAVWTLLAVLTGTFYGIPWIHTLNWNAWTSFLLSIGLIFLLRGIKKDSQFRLFIAGFILAINTYFRFPNMLFLSLIAVIWWKEILEIIEEDRVEQGLEKGQIRSVLRGTSIKRIIVRSLGFFFGACLGAAVGLGLAIYLLGPDVVLKNLSMLMSVGAGENDANTHSITTGIYLFLLSMRDGAKRWVLYGAPIVGLWAVGEIFTKKPGTSLGAALPEEEAAKEKAPINLFRIYICLIAGLALGLNLPATAAHEWVAFAGVAFGILGAFVLAMKGEKLLSCLCVATVAILGFLTIGTDTGVNFYRVYLGLPLATVLMLFYQMERFRGYRCRHLSRMLMVFTLAFVMTAGAKYASTHVYHDAPIEELTTQINHPDYKGILTSRKRAESLNHLMRALKPYEEKKLLQIGCFNAGTVLTDLKPFFDSSWPDLEYLTAKDFDEGIEAAVESGDLPVLLVGKVEASAMNWNRRRYDAVVALGDSDLYKVLVDDEIYTIYVPVEK